MDKDDALDASVPTTPPRTPNSITVVPPNRDLFRGRSNPMIFALSYRPRQDDPVSIAGPSSSPAKDGARAPPPSPAAWPNPKSKYRPSIQRHVTTAIALDASAYASYGRYSQKQFDEEAAEEEMEHQLREKIMEPRTFELGRDVKRALRQFRASNNKLSGRGRRRQSPFNHMAKNSRAGRAAGDAPPAADGDLAMRFDAQLHLHHRDTRRVHTSGRIKKRTIQRRPPSQPLPYQLFPGVGDDWEDSDLLVNMRLTVWTALDTIPGLAFDSCDNSPATRDIIAFLGTIMSDPSVVKTRIRHRHLRAFLVTLVTLAPRLWSWKPGNSQQLPWVLPDIQSLSLSLSNGKDAEAHATPVPCGPDDSAFWSWLATQLAKPYAFCYAMRRKVATRPAERGTMALLLSNDETDGNSALAIGRSLQALVQFLVAARQRYVEQTVQPASPEDTLDSDVVDSFASLADLCTFVNATSSRDEDSRALSKAVDLWCMWQVQAVGGQLDPSSSWAQTCRQTHKFLLQLVENQRGFSEARARQSMQHLRDGISRQDHLPDGEEGDKMPGLRW